MITTFEKGSGQLLSPNKCSLLVNEDLDGSISEQVRSVLGVERVDFEAKYLGLPTPNGRVRRGLFQPLEERFHERMIAWKEKYLSAAGKEVLIKSVAQALPIYIMSVFKLPLTLCDELMKKIRVFWWGAEKGRRKVQWIPWEKLVLPKGLGGMGFKDLRLMNQALLARQAWRLVAFPDSLCARVSKAKYYPNSKLLDRAPAGDASQTWRAIEYGLELLKQGVIHRIGNGRSTQIWRDNWLPRGYGLKPIGPMRSCRLRWVHHLIDDSGAWDEMAVRRYFFLVMLLKFLRSSCLLMRP